MNEPFLIRLEAAAAYSMAAADIIRSCCLLHPLSPEAAQKLLAYADALLADARQYINKEG